MFCVIRFVDPWFLDMVRMKALDQHQRTQQEVITDKIITVEIDNDSIRERGQWPWPRNELAKENFNGDIENVYTLKILNKSQKDNRYRLSVKGINNTTWHGEQEVLVKAAKVYTLPISISVDPYELEGYMTDISFVIELVSDTDEVKLEHESRFFNKR